MYVSGIKDVHIYIYIYIYYVNKKSHFMKCGSLVKELISHHEGEKLKFSYLQPRLNCLST